MNAMSLPASRVLLIEDDLKLAEVLSTLLREDRITIENVGNASDALTLLRTEKFDLVLLDLGLPDANGFDVLAKLRERPDAFSLRFHTYRSIMRCNRPQARTWSRRSRREMR